MQEVASDQGMSPVTGEAKSPSNDVTGLIAAVETKMSELMAWHEQQQKQLETDKTVLKTEGEKQREAFDAERGELDSQRKQLDEFRTMLDGKEADLESQNKQLAERIEQVDQQRTKLVELTSKLRAEESAMSREWADVQREREAVQQRANDIAKLREQTQSRAKQWLDETAEALSQPLKLTDHDDQVDEQDGDHSHAA